MLLDYLDGTSNSSFRDSNQGYQHDRGSTSAPAHIAFSTTTSPASTLPSPDVDLDISPLTSPWLGADGMQYQTQQQQQQPHPPQVSPMVLPGPSLSRQGKRAASPNNDDDVARKKQSPAILPSPYPSTSPNFSGAPKRRTTKSASSTPLIRSTRSRRESVGMGPPVQDSPSPVDMPPPAAPVDKTLDGQNHQQIKPVTPAMMMNISRMGSASVPVSPVIVPHHSTNGASKGKGKDDNGSLSRAKPVKKPAGSSLKTLLPGKPFSLGILLSHEPH